MQANYKRNVYSSVIYTLSDSWACFSKQSQVALMTSELTKLSGNLKIYMKRSTSGNIIGKIIEECSI